MKQLRAALQTADSEAEFPAELVSVAAAAVGKFAPFEPIPDALVGVELWRVGGQPFEVEPVRRTRRQERLHSTAAVDHRPIPDASQLPRNLAQELAEEGDDALPRECLLLDMGEEAEDVLLTGGATGVRECLLLDMGEEAALGCDAADDGQVVAGEGRAQDGRLTAWRVGACHERQEVKAGFIYKDDRSVFLRVCRCTLGQTRSRQAAIAPSSRCHARCTGFCGVQPRRRRMRPTCDG